MNLPDAEPVTQAASWPPLPEAILLAPDEVHVTMALLDVPASDVAGLKPLLAEDERKRADRFYFERDRRRYIVARARLRTILSRYLQTDPARLRFSHTPYGKPFLINECNPAELRFNVSHSDRIALYAMTLGRAIGVDLERIRASDDNQRIAERFFSDREVAALRALAPDVQDDAFFACWTRKEAYLKAKGSGFSQALSNFDTSEAARWSLRELVPAPGYVAAVAVEGQGWQLKRWHYSE